MFGVHTYYIRRNKIDLVVKFLEVKNTEKTKQLTAGVSIYIGINLLMYCNEIIIAIDTGKAFLKVSDFPLMIVGIIVNFVPAILYLVGARRNRPAGEQVEVEDR